MVGKQSLWLAIHPRCWKTYHFPSSRFQISCVRHNARDNEQNLLVELAATLSCKGSFQERVLTVQQRLYAIAVFKNYLADRIRLLQSRTWHHREVGVRVIPFFYPYPPPPPQRKSKSKGSHIAIFTENPRGFLLF